MPLRRWIIDPALVITCIFCLAGFVVVAIDYAYLKAKQDISEQVESVADTDKAKRHIDKVCFRLSGFDWRECALDAVEAIKEEDQDTRDLNAQERMARWALWMFVAASAGTVVAVYGLVLIRRTWAEAKRTADIAREIGEAQVRGYVIVKSHQVSFSGDELTFDLCIEAIGQSPIRSLTVNYIIRIGFQGGEAFRSDWGKNGRTVTVQQPVDITPGSEGGLRRVFRIGDFEISEDIQAGFAVQPKIFIEFTDVFGRTVFEHQHWSGLVHTAGEDVVILRLDSASGPILDAPPEQNWSEH